MIRSKIFTGIFLSAAVLALPSCNSGKSGDQAEEEAGLTASATLDASQETQEVTSDGTGTLAGTYDEATGELTFQLEWSALSGAPSMMHFHGPASPGTDAGVKIPITDFPTEASGSVSQTVSVDRKSTRLTSSH